MPNHDPIPAIRERHHVLALHEPRSLRPETREYVDYLRAAGLRALKGLPPNGPIETRLWAVFVKLGARDPELAARLSAAPVAGGPDPDAPAALWAGHRARVLGDLRRVIKPAKTTQGAADDKLNKEPWKRLTFDIVRVKCHDPQDGTGRGHADELHVTTNWEWKAADGAQNDGVNSSYFTDVAKGDEVYPKAADITFIGAFKKSKRFPCRFSATVVLTDQDNGGLVKNLGELLDIIEDEFENLGGDDGDVPWYVEVLETLADLILQGLRDDVLGAFRTEVTLENWRAMFPTTGKKTSGTKSATIQGSINKGSYKYTIDYRWTLA